MRMAGLAQATGVPVATLKYYLREGLLHPGRATSRTQAEYDDSHVERVRLVRALHEVGGLGLAAVGRVLATIDDPQVERLGVLAAAQQSLYGEAPDDPDDPDGPDGSDGPDGPDSPVGRDGRDGPDGPYGRDEHDEPDEPRPTQAARWLTARGWHVAPGDRVIAELDRAWGACDDAGIGLDERRMDAYADAVERIAAIDVDTVPAQPQAAVRHVILGTVLVDPVLAALRRLAHQHTSVSRHEAAGGGVGGPG